MSFDVLIPGSYINGIRKLPFKTAYLNLFSERILDKYLSFFSKCSLDFLLSLNITVNFFMNSDGKFNLLFFILK